MASTQANGESAESAATGVRGRAEKRISRLEERLSETSRQLDGVRGRREELEELLQRMVETETQRRDQLQARERDLEQRRSETEDLLDRLEERAREAENRAAASEQRENEMREEVEQLRQDLQELQSRYAGEYERRADLDERAKHMREEMQELRAQAESIKRIQPELEAKAEAAEQRTREAKQRLQEQMRDVRERLESQLEAARAKAAEERSRYSALEAEMNDTRAKLTSVTSELEEAQARAATEQSWHEELETRLERTEQQAESVLKEINNELEVSFGRVALERERRIAAEVRVAELTESEQGLQETVSALRSQLEGYAGDGSPPAAELQEALEKIEKLQEALNTAREAPEKSEDGDLVSGMRKQIEAMREELVKVRAAADDHEQARKRILRLEHELSEARTEHAAVSHTESSQEGSETRSRRFARGGWKPPPGSRRPPRDAEELVGMSDEHLSQTFVSLTDAAALADHRGRPDDARGYRALARAAAEEAARRPNFGEGKVRGRKRQRAMRGLAAARKRALWGQHVGATPDAGSEDTEDSENGEGSEPTATIERESGAD